MSRLIVSGCSFTNYWHPTWAWFLSSAYDETYNYGKSGAGNEYIYHSIIDADTDLQLTENDTVVIAWSGYSRFDRFIKTDTHPQWLTHGDWSHNPDKSLESFVSDDGWARKSVNYIAATARYLKSKNIKYIFTSLYDLRVRSSDSGSKTHTDTYIVKLLDDIYNDNFIYPYGLAPKIWRHRDDSQSGTRGGHPNLSEHQLLATGIAAKLGVTMDTHIDLAYYDSLISDDTSSDFFGKILPLLHKQNIACILTKESECISPSIEKYYSTTIHEYKKLVTELFIK